MACTETAECKARQVNAAYAARDWTRVSRTLAKILRDVEVPVEEAFGAHMFYELTLAEQLSQCPDALARRGTQVLALVCFVPRAGARAARALQGMPLTPSLRRAAMRYFYDHPDELLAFDTCFRLGGMAAARSYIRAFAVRTDATTIRA